MDNEREQYDNYYEEDDEQEEEEEVKQSTKAGKLNLTFTGDHDRNRETLQA